MYGFTGYGTNSYGSFRQEPSATFAVIATRTIVALTNFTRYFRI